MVRKTREDAQETRESILNAAEDCLLELGVARTSLEAIATRAGVTRGAVYWHFKNKAEVVDEVINRVSVPFFHGLERVSRADGSTPLRDLRDLLHSSFANLADTPRLRSVIELIELRCETPAEGDAISDLRKAGMHKTHARILAAFAHAAALGHLRPGMEPESCARSLHFVISGALRMHLLDPHHIDLKRHGLAALDLTLHAVASDPAHLEPES